MNSWQKYAEAVNSGKYSQVGDADILPDSTIVTKNRTVWHYVGLALMAVIFILSVLALVWSLTADDEDVTLMKTKGPIKYAQMTAYEWALSAPLGWGLKCTRLVRYSDTVWLMHQCKFTIGNEYEDGKVKLGKVIQKGDEIWLH